MTRGRCCSLQIVSAGELGAGAAERFSALRGEKQTLAAQRPKSLCGRRLAG